MNFITSSLQKVVAQMGAVILIEPEYQLVGYIIFENGKRVCFSRSKLDINGYGAAELAKDKAFSNFFLKQFGYSVPEGQTFFNAQLCTKLSHPRNIDDGFDFAQEIGFPVIVKPLNLSQGILVTKVYNRAEYYHISEKIFQIKSGLIVERFCSGNDYRIVVLDQEVVVVYQRIPLCIVGDGKSNICDLLSEKKKYFAEIGRKVTVDLDDFRIHQKLERQNLSWDSVIPQATIVYLLDNANLSNGGESVDLTETIHPDFQKLAVNVTKDIGLRLAGIDIIASDITKPMSDYTLLEVNGSPGLTHYAANSEIHLRRVENLYLKVLQALENGR
jgi:D-alanine-D-alanine ligase-like ATP-grasp enzyme